MLSATSLFKHAVGLTSFMPKQMTQSAFSTSFADLLQLSAYHLPMLLAGGHGFCLTQCRHAKIITSRTIPMQVDGEAVRLNPSEINVSFYGQVTPFVQDRSNIASTNTRTCFSGSHAGETSRRAQLQVVLAGLHRPAVPQRQVRRHERLPRLRQRQGGGIQINEVKSSLQSFVAFRSDCAFSPRIWVGWRRLPTRTWSACGPPSASSGWRRSGRPPRRQTRRAER